MIAAATPVTARPRNIQPNTRVRKPCASSCAVTGRPAAYSTRRTVPSPTDATAGHQAGRRAHAARRRLRRRSICGASFAGLAVARELAGSGARVLLLDRYEIGERQTSACAAPTEWLRGDRASADSMRQTFDTLVVHTPHTPVDFRLPWTFSTFDYRQLCGLLCAQCDAEFETAKVDGRDRHRGPHGPRSDLERPARRRRAGLEAGAGGQRVPAAGRAALARARGASGRRADELEIWIDRDYVPAGYGWSFPAGDEVADRRRLVRPAPPRQGADRAPRRGPRPRRGALPGQLDPAQAAPGDRRRRLLRRRLRRPLPAADRGGHPHRASTSASPAGASCGAWSRAGRASTTALRRYARLLGPPPLAVRVRCCGYRSWSRGSRRELLALALRGMERGSFVDWSFGHYLQHRPPVVRESGDPAARAPGRARARRLSGSALADDQKVPASSRTTPQGALGRDRLLRRARGSRPGRARSRSSAGR